MVINTPFVLASTSRSRILILKKIGLEFISIKHNCNESLYKKKFKRLKYSSNEVSLELSKIKAKSVSANLMNKLIVGSDTVIDYKGNIIDKVKTMKKAHQKIKKLSGKKHTIISSIAAYYNNELVWANTEKTIVKIRNLSAYEINQYLNMCGPTILNSVGCYQIEKNGPIIIENIQGDFFNVMGFPLFSFLKFLKKLNEK